MLKSHYYNVIQPINGCIMEITPKIAEEWLKKNIGNNRNPRTYGITAYATDMANGNWGLTPDAIAFNEDGILINGQHRLNAIVKSGVTINAFVVFGFPMSKKDFLNLDNGVKRTFRDMIRTGLSDDEAVKLCGDIASAYIRLKYSPKIITPSVRIDFIHANHDIVVWAAKLCRHSVYGSTRSNVRIGASRVPSVIAVAIMDAYMCGENEDTLRAFAEAYCDNNFNGLDQKQINYVLELRGKNHYSKEKEDLLQAKSYIKAFARHLTRRIVTENDYPAPRLKLRAEDSREEA